VNSCFLDNNRLLTAGNCLACRSGDNRVAGLAAKLCEFVECLVWSTCWAKGCVVLCRRSESILLIYLLTPWSRVLLEQLTVKKFPTFMEPEGSLPHPQVPATCPYPEPAPSILYPHIPLPEDPS